MYPFSGSYLDIEFRSNDRIVAQGFKIQMQQRSCTTTHNNANFNQNISPSLPIHNGITPSPFSNNGFPIHDSNDNNDFDNNHHGINFPIHSTTVSNIESQSHNIPSSYTRRPIRLNNQPHHTFYRPQIPLIKPDFQKWWKFRPFSSNYHPGFRRPRPHDQYHRYNNHHVRFPSSNWGIHNPRNTHYPIIRGRRVRPLRFPNPGSNLFKGTFHSPSSFYGPPARPEYSTPKSFPPTTPIFTVPPRTDGPITTEKTPTTPGIVLPPTPTPVFLKISPGQVINFNLNSSFLPNYKPSESEFNRLSEIKNENIITRQPLPLSDQELLLDANKFQKNKNSCDLDITSRTFSFQSPGYPGPYFIGMDCIYKVSK